MITSVAANVGDVDVVLAGRPGSWEADCIRQIVLRAAGDDLDALLRFRTMPVQLKLDVVWEFAEMGIEALHEEASDLVWPVEEQAQDELLDAVATEEKQRLRALDQERTSIGFPADDVTRQRGVALLVEADEIRTTVEQRAERTAVPLAAALTTARRRAAVSDELYEQDQADYRRSYEAAAGALLSTRGAHVDVEVVDGIDDLGDPVAKELHEYAHASAPLPMTGAVAGWSDGTPADILRRAGLSYVNRIDRMA